MAGGCGRQGAQPFHSQADHRPVDPTISLAWGLLLLTFLPLVLC